MTEINETPEVPETPSSEPRTEQPASPEPDASPEQPAGAEQPASTEQFASVQQEQVSEEVNKDARMWAMFCHLAGLAGFVIPVILSGIIAPLIIWQIKKDDHPFIDENGKEALNFQISIGIYALVSILLIPLFCIGAFLLTAVGIFNLVFMLIAAIKANNGFHYRYPLCIRFIK
jgi:uncharacterized Tic20 family protein